MAAHHHLVHNVEYRTGAKKLSKYFIRIGKMRMMKTTARTETTTSRCTTTVLDAVNTLAIVCGAFVTIRKDFVGFGDFYKK